MVTESLSLTAYEAHKEKVVDFAADIDELLENLEVES